MQQDWIVTDSVLLNINQIVENCADHNGIKMISIVLFGSRARGDRNYQNDYELLLLVENGTELKSYIKFLDIIRIELLKEKLFHVKIQVYTPEIFEEVLYGDYTIGTYLYMICRDHIILYDRDRIFSGIHGRLVNSEEKNEEVFLNQCMEFSRMLGSEKWERKWEKTLMQMKYYKNRRNNK